MGPPSRYIPDQLPDWNFTFLCCKFEACGNAHALACFSESRIRCLSQSFTGDLPLFRGKLSPFVASPPLHNLASPNSTCRQLPKPPQTLRNLRNKLGIFRYIRPNPATLVQLTRLHPCATSATCGAAARTSLPPLRQLLPTPTTFTQPPAFQSGLFLLIHQSRSAVRELLRVVGDYPASMSF